MIIKLKFSRRKMELTGLKDLDREILKFIPDKELLRVCSINRRFWHEVCDDAFLKRRLSSYPDVKNQKEEKETWKCFFLRVTYLIFQMKQKYDFDYSCGNIFKQRNLLQKYKVKKLLCVAARKGELKLVKYAISKGINLRYKDDKSLRYAAEFGHLQVVKYLVENGADVNGYGGSILRFPCSQREERIEVVKYLVENGAFADIVALKNAVKYSNLEMVKYLLEHGANVHDLDNYWIITSCERGKFDTIEYLIEIGLDIHMQNDILLLEAIKNKKLAALKYLLSKGLRLNPSIELANLAVIDYLESQELDIKIYNSVVIKSAVRFQKLNVLRHFLEKDFDISVIEQEDLDYILQRPETEFVKYLASQGIDLYADDFKTYRELEKRGFLNFIFLPRTIELFED